MRSSFCPGKRGEVSQWRASSRSVPSDFTFVRVALKSEQRGYWQDSGAGSGQAAHSVDLMHRSHFPQIPATVDVLILVSRDKPDIFRGENPCAYARLVENATDLSDQPTTAHHLVARVFVLKLAILFDASYVSCYFTTLLQVSQDDKDDMSAIWRRL